MKVATHRDGSELDYNEANGLFSLDDIVVTVQLVARLDRGRKLIWTTPDNRDWFKRIAAVDNVSMSAAPRKRNGCLTVFAVIGILFCVMSLCLLSVLGAALNAASKQVGASASSVTLPRSK